ncbi:MAG: hydroxypyruvate isomerase family protein [Roseobacter sp.]
MKFSANLGFLWNDRPLPDAIRAAKAAGFDAVECHWPYAIPAEDVAAALAETGLSMLGLNTSRGNLDAGENGLSALVGREDEARAAIDQALLYAQSTGTQNIHVMAGFAQGAAAENCFVDALIYACDKAAPLGVAILIEPLNHYDAPGYFLSTTQHAKEIISRVDRPNIKLMFDCYHVQLMEGDLTHRLAQLMPIIGHIQFARVPDRGPPVGGEVNFDHIFQTIADLKWVKPLGAEYKSDTPTDDTLDWLKAYRP